MKKGIIDKEWMLSNGTNPYLGPGGCLNEIIIRVFYKQLVSAIEYIHKKKIIHRDIKPQNIMLVQSYSQQNKYYIDHRNNFENSINNFSLVKRLNQIQLDLQDVEKRSQSDVTVNNSLASLSNISMMNEKDNDNNSVIFDVKSLMNYQYLPVLKIVDFGLAFYTKSNTAINKGHIGTLQYMAPEVVNGIEATYSSDLWSIGATIYECISGECPYRYRTRWKEDKREKDNDIIRRPQIQKFSYEIKYMLSKILSYQPEERLNYSKYNDILFNYLPYKCISDVLDLEKECKEEEEANKGKETKEDENNDININNRTSKTLDPNDFPNTIQLNNVRGRENDNNNSNYKENYMSSYNNGCILTPNQPSKIQNENIDEIDNSQIIDMLINNSIDPEALLEKEKSKEAILNNLNNEIKLMENSINNSKYPNNFVKKVDIITVQDNENQEQDLQQNERKKDRIREPKHFIKQTTAISKSSVNEKGHKIQTNIKSIPPNSTSLTNNLNTSNNNINISDSVGRTINLQPSITYSQNSKIILENNPLTSSPPSSSLSSLPDNGNKNTNNNINNCHSKDNNNIANIPTVKMITKNSYQMTTEYHQNSQIRDNIHTNKEEGKPVPNSNSLKLDNIPLFQNEKSLSTKEEVSEIEKTSSTISKPPRNDHHMTKNNIGPGPTSPLKIHNLSSSTNTLTLVKIDDSVSNVSSIYNPRSSNGNQKGCNDYRCSDSETEKGIQENIGEKTKSSKPFRSIIDTDTNNKIKTKTNVLPNSTTKFQEEIDKEKKHELLSTISKSKSESKSQFFLEQHQPSSNSTSSSFSTASKSKSKSQFFLEQHQPSSNPTSSSFSTASKSKSKSKSQFFLEQHQPSSNSTSSSLSKQSQFFPEQHQPSSNPTSSSISKQSQFFLEQHQPSSNPTSSSFSTASKSKSKSQFFLEQHQPSSNPTSSSFSTASKSKSKSKSQFFPEQHQPSSNSTSSSLSLSKPSHSINSQTPSLSHSSSSSSFSSSFSSSSATLFYTPQPSKTTLNHPESFRHHHDQSITKDIPLSKKASPLLLFNIYDDNSILPKYDKSESKSESIYYLKNILFKSNQIR
ncbi:hypothetical protein H8356DRAFT_1078954 [Neocallimastix lanati (nom. inval.)]|nr:hypothetical protein H8356DRAFT_1078954 [Neocallimastix sp. JGI-2020a]